MEITGILHCHSTHSYDGKVPLKELKRLLQAEGISFVCMSEHTDTLTPESAATFVSECSALSDESFLFIPGFEVPYKPEGARGAAHILMLGCRQFVSAYAKVPQLRAWREAAALAILAHPVRNDFVVDDVMCEVIDGIEIWNQQYDGKRVSRPRAVRLLEKLKQKKPACIATGGLDLHRPEHLTYPRISIELDTLGESSVLAKISQGDFTIFAPTHEVAAKGPYTCAYTRAVRGRSALSTATIKVGKTVNKTLKVLGLRLPKGLVGAIRSRV